MSWAILTLNGKLVGVNYNYNEATQLGIPGISIIEMPGEIPNLNKVVWDEENQEFKITSKIITKLEFISKFTTEERLAAYNSSDPIIKDAFNMLQLATDIDLEDSRTIQLVQYLTYVGILTPQRAMEILK